MAPASECRVVRGRQRPRRECDDLGVQICGRREAVAGQASRQRKHASPSEEARQGSAQTWHPGEVPLLLDRSRRRSRQRHSLRRRLLLGPRTRRHLLLGPCLHRCLLLLGPRLRRCLLLDPRLRFRRHRVRRPLGAGRTTRSTGSTCSDPANLCAEMDRRRGPKGSFFWAGSKIRWAEPIQPHYDVQPLGSLARSFRSAGLWPGQQCRLLTIFLFTYFNSRILVVKGQDVRMHATVA